MYKNTISEMLSDRNVIGTKVYYHDRDEKINIDTAKKYIYPKKPKFIFTSNIFESDEAFKYYLANIINQVEKPKYFVGQHGNAYFTRIDNNFRTEVKTCDYFISWGEVGYDNKKMINLFNLKIPHIKKKKEC